MGRPLTSEEKLLHLIRRKKDGDPRAEQSVNDEPAELHAKKAAAKKAHDQDGWLIAATRTLMILCIGILGYGVYKFYYVDPLSVVAPESEQWTGPKRAVRNVSAFEGIKPFGHYSDALGRRDIFQAPWEKPEMGISVVGKDGPELGKLLRLVGIVLDRDPRAVVEDLQTKQTVFLSQGQQIGSAVLEDILADRVIFVYNGARVELTP